MVTVKEKTTVTQRVHGDCPTHSRTEISVRDVKSPIDQPKEREGTNMGPTPTETMLAAALGMINFSMLHCSRKIARNTRRIRSASGTRLSSSGDILLLPAQALRASEIFRNCWVTAP